MVKKWRTTAKAILIAFMECKELRWNFSNRARELSGGDVVGVSIPKSGRTWVRTDMAYVAEAMRELDPRFG